MPEREEPSTGGRSVVGRSAQTKPALRVQRHAALNHRAVPVQQHDRHRVEHLVADDHALEALGQRIGSVQLVEVLRHPRSAGLALALAQRAEGRRWCSRRIRSPSALQPARPANAGAGARIPTSAVPVASSACASWRATARPNSPELRRGHACRCPRRAGHHDGRRRCSPGRAGYSASAMKRSKPIQPPFWRISSAMRRAARRWLHWKRRHSPADCGNSRPFPCPPPAAPQILTLTGLRFDANLGVLEARRL